MGLYFPFAVLTPIWLCCSLLHVALPRRGSRHFALSVLATLLFLMLGTSTQPVLRNVTLQAGMAMVLVVLAQALAKKERPAWYLLAGYILTFGLRLTIILPSFRFWFYREVSPSTWCAVPGCTTFPLRWGVWCLSAAATHCNLTAPSSWRRSWKPG